MTAADKLRELLATRPAFASLEDLVRWWRTSADLVPQMLAERDVLKQEVRELEQQRDALRAELDRATEAQRQADAAAREDWACG